jgi:hypothetical protein
MERETGFEPATPSLEGSCSSQLSYSRQLSELRFKPQAQFTLMLNGGEGRIRTSEALRRQIYSLLPLATREPLLLYPDTKSIVNDLLNGATNCIISNQFRLAGAGDRI